MRDKKHKPYEHIVNDSYVEGKMREEGRSAEDITWRTVEKLVEKQHEKPEKPFSWTQED